MAKVELSTTATLSIFALRSIVWSTVMVPNIDHFLVIVGSQKGVSGLFKGSFDLSVAVGLERV